MNVLVVGGHGQIAMRLLRLLAERGDQARGMIRKPDQAADLEEVGAEPVVRDIEEADDISAEVEGSDAVVFAAGAGPGSPERKGTVDLGGAVKLIDACKATGVERYLMVSAMGVERPDSWQENMKPYYEAKRDADDALREAGLAYTIVRPGRLTDDPAPGPSPSVPRSRRAAGVTRDDVAATLLACLDEPRTAGLVRPAERRRPRRRRDRRAGRRPRLSAARHSTRGRRRCGHPCHQGEPTLRIFRRPYSRRRALDPYARAEDRHACRTRASRRGPLAVRRKKQG